LWVQVHPLISFAFLKTLKAAKLLIRLGLCVNGSIQVLVKGWLRYGVVLDLTTAAYNKAIKRKIYSWLFPLRYKF